MTFKTNPVRAPEGFRRRTARGEEGHLEIIVIDYPGYDSASSAPLSKGIRFSSNVQNLAFVIGGYGFDDGNVAFDLQQVPGTPGGLTPPTIDPTPVVVPPSGSTPGTISGTFSLGDGDESVGIYALSVTRDDGDIGCVVVEITAAA